MANAFNRKRKAADLTLAQLADMTGLSEPFLSRVGTGARHLGNAARKKVARALGCSPAELLDDTALPLPHNLSGSDVGGGVQLMNEFLETTAKMLATLSLDDRVRVMQRAAEISEARPPEKATAP